MGVHLPLKRKEFLQSNRWIWTLVTKYTPWLKQNLFNKFHGNVNSKTVVSDVITEW